MADVLAAITGTIALAKQVFELATVSKDVKAKEMVSELRLQLSDLRIKVAELQEENDALKRAAKKAADAPVMVLKDGMYYTEAGDGPFCTTCHDSSGKNLRLVEQPQSIRFMGRWRCGVCTTKYGGENGPGMAPRLTNPK